MKVEPVRSSRSGASRTALIALALLVFVAGLALGVHQSARIRGWLGLHDHAQASAAQQEGTTGQLWTCGMHPQVIQ